ncbi:MAG: helix-turn-helix transcriptional regulator [Eubacteriales bacterium]
MERPIEHKLIQDSRRLLLKDIPFYQVCKMVCVSETTLRKLYHKYLGMSPRTYISRVKLRKVHSMLRTSDLSITALAELVGYSNASKMSVAFRKIYGMSPSEWRKIGKGNRFGVDNPDFL